MLLWPRRAGGSVFGTAGGEVRGRGSSGVIRLAGVAPVQMDIAGAHIPGGDAGIGVPGRCAYGVQRRVAAVQLNVRPVEFVAAEDVAPEPERSVSKHGYLSVAQ